MTTSNVYQELLATAIARGFRWKELLESGSYHSISEMAEKLGLGYSYIARLMRFTLLAPDIVEAVLDGTEPNGFSINQFVREIPANGEDQRAKYGFTETSRA